MLEQSSSEKVCPACGKRFFPECSSFRRTFCGEEEVCLPAGEKLDFTDCRVYEFCSDSCMEQYSGKAPECKYVPRWIRLMERIYKAGSESGIAGARQHELGNCKTAKKVKGHG